MIPSLPRPDALRLILIRSAMLLALLTLGGATWFVQRGGATPALARDATRLYGYAFAGLVPMVVIGLFLMRRRLESATTTAQMLSLYIIGYAMAEGAALLGAVTWYLGGDPNWYIAGLVLMVVAFQILPVKRQA